MQANLLDFNATSANSGTGSLGSCCNEMDIWEANSISAAFTPHPCSVIGQTECTGNACGYPNRYSGVCDPDGCDFNSYRMGDTSFYGPSKTVDTTERFTVVTQFITSDNTSTGTLTEIRRFYVQNGVVIENSQSTIPGVTGNSITPVFCDAQKTAFGDTNDFDTKGGLAAVGESLARGVVLVLSIWDDPTTNMLWLDSDYPPTSPPTTPGVPRGTCPTYTEIGVDDASISVTYSNIKIGPIGSTYSVAGGSLSSSSSGSSSTTKTTSTSTTTSSARRPPD